MNALDMELDRLRALPPQERARGLLAEMKAAAENLTTKLSEVEASAAPPRGALSGGVEYAIYRMICTTALAAVFDVISEPSARISDEIGADAALRAVIAAQKGGDA